MSSGPSGHRAIIGALCGLVVLLLGVIAGQYLERSKRDAADPRASPLASLAPSAADVGDATRALDVRMRVTAPRSPGESGSPQAPLSATEYWVSSPALDATRTGFSAWTALRPGGNFVLEQCRAPDYAIPEDSQAPLPIPVAQCESIIDGLISRLGADEILVQQGNDPPRAFRYSLVREGAEERLLLDVGETVALLPGGKNSLLERLHRLSADERARSRYLRRMFELGTRPR